MRRVVVCCGGEAAGRNRVVPCASRSSSATERVNTRARRAVTRPREPPLARTTARDARPEPAEARGARTARPEPAAETHDMAVRLLLGGRGYTCVPRVRGCGASAGRAGCAPVECDAHHAAVFLISARRWRNEGPPTPVAKSAGQLSRTTFEFECRLNRKQSRKTARTAAISRLARRVSQEQDFRTDFRTIEPPRSGDLSTGDAPNLQPFRVATIESADHTDTLNARGSRIEARGASSRERASPSRGVRAAHRASRRGSRAVFSFSFSERCAGPLRVSATRFARAEPDPPRSPLPRAERKDGSDAHVQADPRR